MATNFPGSLDSYSTKTDNVSDVLAADINNPQDAIEALEAKVGVDSSAVTTSIDYKVNNFFATGRKVYLYENTAPTGWSITAVTDSVLAVKGGTGLYNTTGGTAAGESWANLKAHTHAGPSHTHTGPSHTHSVVGAVKASNNRITVFDVYCDNYQNNLGTSYGAAPDNTYYTTKPQAAGTGVTGAGGTGATGAQSTADVRPVAAVGIICTKA